MSVAVASANVCVICLSSFFAEFVGRRRDVETVTKFIVKTATPVGCVRQGRTSSEMGSIKCPAWVVRVGCSTTVCLGRRATFLRILARFAITDASVVG